MTSDGQPLPAMKPVPMQTGSGEQHRSLLEDANAALAASPAPALLDTVQTLHRIVLAADPKALRSSVGWLGRLLGRDITLQSESAGLRGQLGVHVLQARQQLRALAGSDRQLQALDLALHSAIDELDRQTAGLADQTVISEDPEPGRRLQHLFTLTTSLRTTAAHLQLTIASHLQLSERVEHMLPRVELLLDQQRMLEAGVTEQTALIDAASSIESLQSLLPTSKLADAPPRQGQRHDDRTDH